MIMLLPTPHGRAHTASVLACYRLNGGCMEPDHADGTQHDAPGTPGSDSLPPHPTPQPGPYSYATPRTGPESRAAPQAGPYSYAAPQSGPATRASQSLPMQSVAPDSLAPVAPGERIQALDVLRGIALFGVLTANIWLWFSGVVFRFPAYNAEVWSFSPDGIAFLFIAFFISGKAITTFSFLFGLGFAVQMQRAEARGRGIGWHHSRRLAVLFLFGAIHAVFLWYGDILMAYALLGFGLLLFRRRRDRTLLVWAAVLIVAVPIALGAVPVVMSVLNPEAGPDPAVVMTEMAERNSALLALFASAEPAQIVRGNLQMLQQQWLTPKATFLLSLFGIFLLGLYVGRRRMFEDPAAHRPLLRRTMIYGFGVGVTTTAISLGMRSIPPEEFLAITWMPLAMAFTIGLGMVPFALAYIASATLLMQQPAWRERLSLFAPVGRMALTNYLAQTVICIAVYYFGGLVGRSGPLFGLVLALVIFPAQMAFSAWWLARYRYGPMEWLWRTMTYGRAQPMRLRGTVATAVQPTA
jgi:uncharacterized protein